MSRARTEPRPEVDVFGATVCGPGHVAEGLPNQDAWGRGRIGPTRVVVVSDGMGSRPHAREGARAACKAVVDAVRQWRRHPEAPVDVLLGLVHLLWRARVAPRAPEDCACTCLFAVVEPDGSGITAQLGDGLVVLRDSGGITTLATRADRGFANETCALGATARLSAWNRLPLEKRARSLVLCTDGVADDLLPERLGAFVDWLIADIRLEFPAKRRRMIERELRAWPTPNHLDDKTIAVVHVPGSGA